MTAWGGGGLCGRLAVCVFAGVHNDAKPIQCHWRVKGRGKGCGGVLLAMHGRKLQW